MSLKLLKDLQEELEHHKCTDREMGLRRIIAEIESLHKAITVLKIYSDITNYSTEETITGEEITYHDFDDGQAAREFLESIGEDIMMEDK